MAGENFGRSATMALAKRDRIGLIILIGLFSILGLLMFFTVERPTGPQRNFENNALVQNRFKGQNNGR